MDLSITAEKPVKEVEEMESRSASKEEKVASEEGKVEEKAVQVEPRTGLSFPIKLDGGMQLNCVGLRKKSVLGLGIKIYGFGLYADNKKLKELLKSKFPTAPEKPNQQMYEVAIDSDAMMMVRLVIVFPALTMSLVKKNFDDTLGPSIKKFNGGQKNEELSRRIMGAASDSIRLSPGSEIEVTRLPGYVLQTKVKGEFVSAVESELLCRAYFNMYLGDDPFDKDAKERFGASLLDLFN